MIHGHVIFFGIDCIYTKIDNHMILVPKNEEDLKNLYKYTSKKDFILEYAETIYKKSSVFVKDVSSSIDKKIILNIKYTANLSSSTDINSFVLEGDEIDVFFSPINYYFRLHKNNKLETTDLMYNKEVVDTFNFTYNSIPIVVDLCFGNILSGGIASDLKLHPKLYVKFKETNNINMVYDIYIIVIKFLQLVCHQTEINLLPVYIYGKSDEKIQRLGVMYEKSYTTKYYSKHSDIEYTYFKPYISKLFQLVSDNEDMSFRHFPTNEQNGYNYDALRYLSCYAAFEYECSMNQEEYECVDETPIAEIKNKVSTFLKDIKDNSVNSEEKRFIDMANQRILQLGKQFGQTKKIVNAYKKNQGAVASSMEYIFLQEKTIEKISKELTALRGKIVHANYNMELLDEEVRNIRFLDMLSYSMLLRRAGIDEAGIELVIGCVFKCNFKYMDY